jgi:two-component system, cell cycle sensor histidine kinase and response regulator CckA
MPATLSPLLPQFPGMAYRCRTDAPWSMEQVSAGCVDLTGCRAEDLVDGRGLAFSDLVAAEDRETRRAAIQAALDERRDFSLRYRLRLPDGREKWAFEHGHGQYTSDGSLEAFTGFVADVTDHVRAEGALAASEARYRRLLESVTDYICTVRVSDGRVVDTTHGPGCVAVTGYNSEDYARDALLWHRMVHTDDRPAVEQYAQRALVGTATPIEHRICHRDGSIRWVRNTPVPRFDEHGALVAYDALIADITERKRAEEALRASESFLANVFACIQDGISVLDRDLRIVRVNPAMERWYAHALPLVGKHCYEAYHGRARPCEVCPSLPCLQAGQTRSEVVPRTGPNGETQGWIDLFAFPLIDPGSGEVHGVIEYVRDITVARRAQDALREKEDQFRQAHKMEAIGTLAGGVAHDFNNLLTAILGYADLLRRELPPETSGRRRADEIVRAAGRAATLTRKLLAFSRKQVLAPRTLDLNAVLNDMSDMLRRLITEDIDLTFSMEPGRAMVWADPGQLEQVVLNLVVNASDAMPQGGRLTIETRGVVLDEAYVARHVGARPGPCVMLVVSDTGCGMDAETQSRLFEPFFTTKAPGKGTGLGLATVYGIVKQSGGSIWIYSEVGLGTTVRVYLPCATDATTPAEIAAVVETARTGSETILVVEDEESIGALTAEILRGCGYAVLTATSGPQAYATLTSHPYPIDLLLTDVVMPHMSGRQLGDLARAARPDLAILYVSGYTDETILEHGLLAQAVSFLQKPFAADDLTRKVREVLDGRSRARSAAEDARA